MEVSKIGFSELIDFSDSILKIGSNIEKKSANENKNLKAIMEKNRKDLIGMMDESYQDAFNIVTKRLREKGEA